MPNLAATPRRDMLRALVGSSCAYEGIYLPVKTSGTIPR